MTSIFVDLRVPFTKSFTESVAKNAYLNIDLFRRRVYLHSWYVPYVGKIQKHFTRISIEQGIHHLIFINTGKAIIKKLKEDDHIFYILMLTYINLIFTVQSVSNIGLWSYVNKSDFGSSKPSVL